MATRFQHPIEEIYEATDFEAAMRILARAYRFEARLCARGLEGAAEPEEFWQAELDAVTTAREIYAKHVAEAVKAAIAEMRASPDDSVRDIGEALESHDYSGLAF